MFTLQSQGPSTVPPAPEAEDSGLLKDTGRLDHSETHRCHNLGHCDSGYLVGMTVEAVLIKESKWHVACTGSICPVFLPIPVWLCV